MESGQKLNEQKIAQFKEAFQLFDKDNDNFVDIGQLPLLVRSLYQTPTEAQIGEWIRKIDPDRSGRFEFASFLTLMASEYKEPETQDQLIEAMQSIFKPQGATITMKEFRNVMTNLGEKLTEEQLNELFKELKIQKQNHFNYQDFIRSILTR